MAKGIVTGMIRPQGRKDVTVTFQGLDFNTPDNLICEYIEKFGGVILSRNVVYGKYTEGPFRGKYNGDRKYQVDFTSCRRTMGTYHYLDGAKVRVFYRGNEKTCGRCHKTPNVCLGLGIARDCDTLGGGRVHITDHMRALWAEIGFCPTSFELPDNGQNDGDRPISESASFQRPNQISANSEADQERYVGLKINNFPVEMSDEDIMAFLSEQVDNTISKENVDIVRQKKNATVTIPSGLESLRVREAVTKIDFTSSKKLHLRLPLYCRPIRDITPEKPNVTSPEKVSPGTKPKTPASKIPGLPNKAQKQALERQKKKETEKKKLATKEKETKQNSGEKNVVKDNSEKNAFKVLMGAQSIELDRSNSQGSLPNLDIGSPLLNPAKRLNGELSSPSSPADNVSRKNKVISGSP